MIKKMGQILLALLLLILLIGAFKYKTLKRLYTAIHLFDKEVIIDNFRNIDAHFDVARLTAAPNKVVYPKQLGFQLPDSFQTNNKSYDTEAFLTENQMEGLMIIYKDTIVYEKYSLGLQPNDTHISWSVAKSIVSTLLGIAHDNGLFNLEDPITNYLPQFKGTGYDNVRILDILQMSSGVGFNEDYGDFNSDINRFGRTFALGSSFEDFAKSLKNERPPGTYHHYVSIDTQVLGMLLKKVTGKSLTSYYEEKLWNPLGMQDNGEWAIDKTGMELALGGLNMTLRDYAKIGQLYLHKGVFNGKRIVSEEWVEKATTPSAPHLAPGLRDNTSHYQGYGYQWWIPLNDEGDFFAAGIYDQYIYIQPSKDLVITMLSANYHFKTRVRVGERMHVALFKEVARQFPNSDTLNIQQ